MTKLALRIVGVYSDTPAYPNVYHLLRVLQAHPDIDAEILHKSAWRSETQNSRGRARLWRNFARMLWAHIGILTLALCRRRVAISYLPYPATPLLWLLSWFGRRATGDKVVIDAFISLYDTIVCDRRLYPASSLFAKLLFRIEQRAFRFADRIVVDTPENIEYLATLFRIPKTRFLACPLFTDEEESTPRQYDTSPGRVNVLFVGTMVPLHGISTVVDAARLLEGDDLIRITVIGDGQDNNALLDAPSNVDWQTEWLDETDLARNIADADICLGIFGRTEKANRVIPLKIYAYCRIGRAIVTASTAATNTAAADLDYRPFYTVPAGDPSALADAIAKLANNTDLRKEYAANAARFYRQRLSNAKATATFINALHEVSTSR